MSVRSETGDPIQVAKAMMRLAQKIRIVTLNHQPLSPNLECGVHTDSDGALVTSNAPATVANQSGVVELDDARHSSEVRQQRLRMEGRFVSVNASNSARIALRVRPRLLDPSQTPSETGEFLRFEPATARLQLIAGGTVDILTRELTVAFSDWNAWHQMETGAVAHMNEDHRDATRLYASVLCGAPDGDWQISAIDPEGIDMHCRGRRERLWFHAPLRSTQDLRHTLVALARSAREAAE
ncbi:MAG: DUF2470 domain-containing protein [Pseudomonadota bacterium]